MLQYFHRNHITLIVAIPLNRVGISMEILKEDAFKKLVAIPLNRVGISIYLEPDESVKSQGRNPLKSGRYFNFISMIKKLVFKKSSQSP